MLTPWLNILDVCSTGTRELGPGNRYAIWVQGCPFNCKNCITPEGIPVRVNKIIPIARLAENIIDSPHIEGITISGGEPFLQAAGLSQLLAVVHAKRPELTIILFSGFRLAELDWMEAKELLSMVDVLIDGRYLEKLNDNKGLRGSSNQKIHFLTERLTAFKDYFLERTRNVEVHVYPDRQVTIGVPSRDIIL